MLRKGTEAVVEAMKRLVLHGFVTKHRRSKLIGTPQGQRRRQDSNAYEVHMPDAGLATVPLITAKASGSENPAGYLESLQDRDPDGNLASRPKEEGFWMAEPYRMPDGSWA
jgi:hypothetical protein